MLYNVEENYILVVIIRNVVEDVKKWKKKTIS